MATTTRHTNTSNSNQVLPPANDPFVIQQRPRPQCTHTNMNRIHGPYRCDQCGHVSEYGWVYQCAQDVENNVPISSDEHFFMALAPKDWDHRKEMSALGISPSVLAQYDAGLYTSDQVQKIKDQKRYLHQVLVHEINSEINRASLFQYAAESIQRSPSGAVRPSEDTQDQYYRQPAPTMRRLGQPDTVSMAICRFKCCHRCRPFYRDRVYTSFEEVMNGETAAIAERDAGELQVLDANVLKRISYNALRPATDIPSNTTVHDFAKSPTREPSSELSSVTLSTSASTGSIAVYCDDVLHSPIASTASSPVASMTPSSLASPRTTLSSISLPITPSSVHDWSAEAHDLGPLSDHASAPHDTWPLPSNATMGGGEKEEENKSVEYEMTLPIRGGRPNEGTRTSSSALSSLVSASSYHDEMDVEGGVALTEAAVGTGVPDIITRPGTPDIDRPTSEYMLATKNSINMDTLDALFPATSGHQRTETQT
ncbi:hypothetical protein BDZ85DRAFT_307866 [Elsinoe ampelina]|uniref:Uncharacterized protein n=1 Tax=Elsinoe ampelina TaxID=302913 RepID=A0A6A6GJG5_9PEZI|nr:hypothetical protein BDZ85DRAFT_307866 [Elsinoe ampelina]